MLVCFSKVVNKGKVCNAGTNPADDAPCETDSVCNSDPQNAQQRVCGRLSSYIIN